SRPAKAPRRSPPITTPSGRAIPPSRGSDAVAPARDTVEARPRPTPPLLPELRPPGRVRAAYSSFLGSWLPDAPGEEPQQRQNDDDDQDDPKNAHMASFAVASTTADGSARLRGRRLPVVAAGPRAAGKGASEQENGADCKERQRPYDRAQPREVVNEELGEADAEARQPGDPQRAALCSAVHCVRNPGLEYDEVGGGAFGILVRSHWEFCKEQPAPGKRATKVVLVVDRDCYDESDD